jgi:DNA-binding CsgD family transcriptional regulator
MSGKPKEPLTTEQKAQIATLAASGMSQNKISKQIGRSRHAVRNCLAEPETQLAVRNERQELAQLCKQKARAIVESIDGDTISKGNLLQKATAGAIMIDKSLLLAGEAPVVNVTLLLDVMEAIREKRDEESERYRIEYQKTHSLPPPAENET